MYIYRCCAFLLLLTLLLVIGGADSYALQESRSIATDHRIRTLRYSPNEVFSFTGYYGYQSIIEFAEDEEIGTISIGDSIAWQTYAEGSRLFIKPVEQDAMTNMTVITDKRLYHFELYGEDTESIRDKGLTFVLRFSYPESYGVGFASNINVDGIPDLEDPEVKSKLNFRYSIVGTEVVSPIRIFDDGEFTYFQFRDKNADVPAFFQVDPAGNEGLINFRTRGDYIVVERVSPRFTLRHGSEVVCIYNDALQMQPKVEAVSEKGIFSRILGR